MLSENIKKARNDRHLSQRALADIIGVSQQTIGSWEVGRTSPDNEMLKKLASFFNVSVDYIMGLSDDPHGSPFTGHVDGQFLTFAPEPIKPEEMALLEAYRKAPDHIRQIVATSLKPYQQAEPKQEQVVNPEPKQASKPAPKKKLTVKIKPNQKLAAKEGDSAELEAIVLPRHYSKRESTPIIMKYRQSDFDTSGFNYTPVSAPTFYNRNTWMENNTPEQGLFKRKKKKKIVLEPHEQDEEE